MAITSKQKLVYNLTFLTVSIGIVLFLLNAPEETTHKIPMDEDHKRFHTMDRKEAEKFCEECHNPEGILPLPEGHPPKYRCIFCHKQLK